VLVAAAARSRRGTVQEATVARLVDEVFAGRGMTRRALPEAVASTLQALEAARRGSAAAAA
jgi:hypothetical protein